MRLTEDEQKKMVDLIRTIDLQEMAIPDEVNRKWYLFGAYDALKILTDRILENE